MESDRKTCLDPEMTRRFFMSALVAFAWLFASPLSSWAGSKAPEKRYEETCRGDGFEILVSARKQGRSWAVRLEPKGLSMDSRIQTFEKDDPLTRVIFEDMNGDGSQELFLVFTNPGSGSYGSLMAFTTNRKKSLTDIVIAEPDAKDLEGYMGHDQFDLVEGTLVRRFPVYKKGDTAANPTGGWRQFQYKLRSGEAAWHLRLDRVVSF